MNERRAALEAKEEQLKAKKLATAAAVRAWKEESTYVKQQRDEDYRSRVKQEFYQKVQDQQSIYSNNAEEIQYLEHEEKAMVEKLNQTRQSAMSAQARPGRNMRMSQSIQSPSPYKPMGKDA